MTFLQSLKTKLHYADKTPLALTPEEQDLYYKQKRKQISAWINEEDLKYIQENDLVMNRIIFFLVHDWLAKKKKDWQED